MLWRPCSVDDCPPIGKSMPAALAPSALVLMHSTSKLLSSKPAGTYQPPGACGLAAPSIFKCGDKGSVAACSHLHEATVAALSPVHTQMATASKMEGLGAAWAGGEYMCLECHPHVLSPTDMHRLPPMHSCSHSCITSPTHASPPISMCSPPQCMHGMCHVLPMCCPLC